MITTEDEARAKWCPQYQVATSGGDTSNTYEMDNRPVNWVPDGQHLNGQMKYRADGIHKQACCLGSGCMWWRWVHPFGSSRNEDGPHGYCGKAGKP